MKGNGIIFFGLLSIFTCKMLNAQSKTDVDTSFVEVLVLQNKHNVFLGNKRQFVNLDIHQRLRIQEGLYIKEGSGKMLSSLRINGASAAQTNMVWNGLRLNSPLNGQVDINLIPSALLNLGIANLGAASFGSGSMAGTLLLENASTDSQFYVGLNTGSFGTYNLGIKKTFNIKKTALNIGINAHQSKNNFPFVNSANEGEITILNNAHAKIFHAIIGAKTNLNASTKLEHNFWFSNANRQIPGTVFNLSSKAFQLDESWRFQTALLHKKNKQSWQFSSALGIDNLRYNDDLSNINSFYKIALNSNAFNYQYKLGKLISLATSFEHEQQQALIFVGNPKGIQTFGWGTNFSFAGKTAIQFGASLKSISLGYLPINYDLNIKRRFNKLLISTISNSSFRAPTFNDLYWPISGNIDLKAEQGWSNGINLKYYAFENKGNFLTVALHSKYQIFQNQIVWVPNAAIGNWQPVNIKKSVHFSSMLVFKGFLKTRHCALELLSNFSYNRANEWNKREQLIYNPTWLSNTMISCIQKNHSLSVFYTNQSKTFINPENTDWLLGYATSDLKYGYRLKLNQKEIQFTAACQNIFDIQYTITESRPMPGRNFNLGLNLTF